MDAESLIKIRDLRYRYARGDRDVLRIPALDIIGKGLIAITGPSGAGKSTLIELLAGTIKEDYEGELIVLGKDWKSIKRDVDWQHQLRRIGLIPQDYGLLQDRTPREMINQDLSDVGIPKSEHIERVRQSLTKVKLSEFADRQITGLSGGQRQRVAIARMLARDVELVIADEPTANLDPVLTRETMRVFRELSESVPVVIITHDPSVASLCDRTIILQATVADADVSADPITSPVSRRGKPTLLVAALGLLLIVASGIYYTLQSHVTRNTVVLTATSSRSGSTSPSDANRKAPAGGSSTAKDLAPASTTTTTTSALPLTATVIQLYSPYSGDTLLPGIVVKQDLQGSCWEGSIADYANSNAWRCDSGNYIYDPCFSNAAQTQVACPIVGDMSTVNVIELTQVLPLRTRNSGANPGTNPYVMLLKLADGATCGYTTGTEDFVDGINLAGGCSNGYGLVAVHSQSPLWTATVLVPSSTSLITIVVTEAWE